MSKVKIKNQGTTSLFENRVLEALTRTHFAFPVTMYLVVSVVILIYAAFRTDLEMWNALYMVPLGLITFSLVEYCIHRFVFHFHPTTEKGETLKYKIHGVHHEFPKDKDRLVMPPILSIVLAVLFYGIFSVLTGKYVLLFFPGFLSGYSIYLFIHYAVHRFRPPRNFLKILWTHHALHHYKSEDTAFGVSMPVWDYLFNTMPAHAREVNEAKQKMHDLL
jgi:4-hydroxysphinganine ceramide fatty acyl 2-hydroxylase